MILLMINPNLFQRIPTNWRRNFGCQPCWRHQDEFRQPKFTLIYSNIWFKKTWTNCSTVSLLWFVQVFLTLELILSSKLHHWGHAIIHSKLKCYMKLEVRYLFVARAIEQAFFWFLAPGNRINHSTKSMPTLHSIVLLTENCTKHGVHFILYFDLIYYELLYRGKSC